MNPRNARQTGPNQPFINNSPPIPILKHLLHPHHNHLLPPPRPLALRAAHHRRLRDRLPDAQQVPRARRPAQLAAGPHAPREGRGRAVRCVRAVGAEGGLGLRRREVDEVVAGGDCGGGCGVWGAPVEGAG